MAVKKAVDWSAAQRKAKSTGRWAVTMTKVRIRRVLSRTRWQLVTFCGESGGESVGIVDLLAVRKDHGETEDRWGDTQSRFGQQDRPARIRGIRSLMK